jgi:RNA polymerase sigma-70 factor (ECF subfamily)
MTVNETLEDMIAAVADGDRVAFRRLYEATARRLLPVSIGILGRRDVAEEALQDAYLNVWRNAAGFDPDRGRGLTWLIAIVRNRALTVRQRMAREGNPAPFDGVDRLADAAPGPLDEALRSSAARALARCLGGLDEVQRRAILLAYYRGLSHAELARALDLPLGTVKSWIRRGLARLKECLDHEAAE